MSAIPRRTAVIGVGGIGRLHALAVSQFEAAELSVVVDRAEDRAATVGAELGVPYCLGVDVLLEQYDIEAAIVAVPDTLHATVTAKLLAAGIPVMLEKPMASSTAEAVELAFLASRYRTRLFVGHTLRFDPRYVAVHDAVRAGDIGRPVHAVAGRWTMRSRRELVRNTSSAAFDLGVHDIDALQWVIGKDIVEVHAYGFDDSDGGPPSCVVANCMFEGGAVGQLYFGWTRLESWPNAIDSRFEVGGSEGVVAVRVHDDGGLIATQSERRFVEALFARTVRGVVGGNQYESIRHFYQCLSTSRDFAIGLNEAISAVAVAETINRSVSSGRAERVERDWATDEVDG